LHNDMKPKAVPARMALAGRAESSTTEFTRRDVIVTCVAVAAVPGILLALCKG
jgi:hypothetical protein